jgi:hypothetical protein
MPQPHEARVDRTPHHPAIVGGTRSLKGRSRPWTAFVSRMALLRTKEKVEAWEVSAVTRSSCQAHAMASSIGNPDLIAFYSGFSLARTSIWRTRSRRTCTGVTGLRAWSDSPPATLGLEVSLRAFVRRRRCRFRREGRQAASSAWLKRVGIETPQHLPGLFFR